jgi:hypothetical protein
MMSMGQEIRLQRLFSPLPGVSVSALHFSLYLEANAYIEMGI